VARRQPPQFDQIGEPERAPLIDARQPDAKQVTWGVRVLSPVGGALTAVGGLLVVSFLAAPDVNLLGEGVPEQFVEQLDNPGRAGARAAVRVSVVSSVLRPPQTRSSVVCLTASRTGAGLAVAGIDRSSPAAPLRPRRRASYFQGLRQPRLAWMRTGSTSTDVARSDLTANARTWRSSARRFYSVEQDPNMVAANIFRGDS
jgi:hypothetical protein